MINALINNISIEVKENTSILEAASSIGVKIPTLCKHPDLTASAACGICIVKIRNRNNKIVRACATNVEEGMQILTHDPDILKTRKLILEMILADHPNDCLLCGRNGTCELQKLLADFGIREQRFDNIKHDIEPDKSTGSIILNPDKCIKCGRCIDVCQHMQDVWALTFLNRGINTRFAPSGDINLAESPCVRCGQCSAHCPVGAIYEYNEVDKALDALNDEEKYCVVQIAPAVRVAIGEAFGLEPGTNMTLKLYAALRRLGFKSVFDTNFGADVTIMEEASEFINRLVNKKGALPLITTCCPSWVDFMEKQHSDMIDHFSSCKSPHEIVGVLSKTYFAKMNNIDPSKIYMVSIMPCTSKKYEISRSDEMYASGYKDVDVVLTTRELDRLFKQAGIDIAAMQDELPDHMLGKYSGAGVIFGASGGVMEAALRTANYFITGKELENLNFYDVRGLEGIKETEVTIQNTKIKIAIAQGLKNVQSILDKIRDAKAKNEPMPYDFIEVMACQGGCIAGGGQPYGINDDVRILRTQALFDEDRKKEGLRCSHENPYVKKLYNEFLIKPLSKTSEELLHTTYKGRKLYKK